jgi:acetyl esterase/lipase
MRSNLVRGLLLALALTGAAACSPLTAFATLTPKDSAGLSARGLTYGVGSRRELDVYAPPASRGAAPVAVFFYGGSWTHGRRQDYGWAARALAARGFLTVVPDYRLGPYPEFLEDGAAVVRWVVEHAAAYGGDPTRIVLAGHSAGAYNAVQLALDRRYLQAAGVDPARIRAVAGLAGPYDFLPLDQALTRRVFGAAQDLPATQPAAYARADAPPAFLATGDADQVVAPRNTRALATALAGKGAVVEQRVYPGLGHVEILLALSRPLRGRAPVLSDMSGFLMDHAQRPRDPPASICCAAAD